MYLMFYRGIFFFLNVIKLFKINKVKERFINGIKDFFCRVEYIVLYGSSVFLFLFLLSMDG